MARRENVCTDCSFWSYQWVYIGEVIQYRKNYGFGFSFGFCFLMRNLNKNDTTKWIFLRSGLMRYIAWEKHCLSTYIVGYLGGGVHTFWFSNITRKMGFFFHFLLFSLYLALCKVLNIYIN